MVRTNNGFEPAQPALELRGPRDLMGTQPSGALDLLIAALSMATQILQMARDAAQKVLQSDPELTNPENRTIKQQIASMRKTVVNWSRIS